MAWIVAGSVAPVVVETCGGACALPSEDMLALPSRPVMLLDAEATPCAFGVEMTLVARRFTLSRDLFHDDSSRPGVAAVLLKLAREGWREANSGGPMAEARIAAPAEDGPDCGARGPFAAREGEDERYTDSEGD
jgi:hypothetical protein